MSKIKYNTGYKVQALAGQIEYLERTKVNNSTDHFAKWKCYCGNIYIARVDYLIKKKFSCGCDRKKYKSGYEHLVPNGKLKYLCKIPTNNSRRHLAEWECFCGKIFKARLDQILNGGYKSCGCKKYTNKYGPGFEKQTTAGVIKNLAMIPNSTIVAKCQCFCSNIFEANVYALAKDKIKSCGCIKIVETIDFRITYINNLYYSIKTRCNNSDDEYYGGRNIKMDSKWENNKKKFVEDIILYLGYRPTDTHQLDRINVNGNYTIKNLRWVTPKENSRNRRSNRPITIGEETKLLIEWSELKNIKESVIRWRLKKNWPLEKLFDPIKLRSNNKIFDGTDIRGLLYGVMKRCYDPKNDAYPYYGGRGILVHEPWRNDNKLFKQEILNSIGPRPSFKHQLDRINVNSYYIPGNLRWATSKENNNNKNNNFYIEYKGEKKTATELSEITGINPGILKRRYLKGCTEEELLRPSKVSKEINEKNTQL